jgi:hypothetical protein
MWNMTYLYHIEGEKAWEGNGLRLRKRKKRIKQNKKKLSPMGPLGALRGPHRGP